MEVIYFICKNMFQIKQKDVNIKGALSGLRQFLATESPLKMVKNTFYFTLKCLFILKIFTLLRCFFDHALKRLDLKDKVNFKFYEVTVWLINYFNKHIT